MEKRIKHVEFTYAVEVDDVFAEGGKRYVQRHAYKEEIADIPLQQDLDRGEKFGAFYDTLEGDAAPEEGEAVPLVEASHDELVAWLQDDKPNIQETVDAAEGDVDLANRILAAEGDATGEQPRVGVVSGLEAIIGGNAG